MASKKAKKRNPQDSTLRNVTAAKRRTTILEARCSGLTESCAALERRLTELEASTTRAVGELADKFEKLHDWLHRDNPPA